MNLNYVAGIIDGEGYVSIDRNSKVGRSLVGKAVVQMASPIIPKLLKKQFGGNYRHYERKNPNQSTAHTWASNGRQSVKFLKKILPMLILKKRQAELVIRLYELKDQYDSFTHPSEAQLRRQYALYVKAKNLCTCKGPKTGRNDAHRRIWE